MKLWLCTHGKLAVIHVAAALALVAALFAEPDFAPGQVLVRFEKEISFDTIRSFERAHHLLVIKRLPRPRGTQVRGALVLYRKQGCSTAQLCEELHEVAHVAYVEPNYARQLHALPDDTDFNVLWGLHNTGQAVNGSSGTPDADIDYPEGWALSRHPEAEVVVGVADTGLSSLHPDLNGNLWTNPAETADDGIDNDGNGYIDDVHGYDFGTDTHHMVDNNGHGTHVSGTIGAVHNNATGIAGVQRGVRLLPLKIEAVNGSLYTSDIIEAFLYAADLKNSGVNLVAVNASFGGPTYTQAEYEAIDVMNTAGVILCTSAGNDGADNNTANAYPANYNLPNIISIASTDQNNDLASFSNYGSISVDLGAPGVNIYSTLPLNLISYTSSLTAGGSYSTTTLEHGGTTGASGITAELMDCGLGYPEDFSGFVSGSIALIQRGDLTFSEKVDNAMAHGAIGVLIYNNENRPPAIWTLGREDNWVPALQLTKSDGEEILAALPLSATLANIGDLTTAYQYLNGTSMACPHVTGAVAFAALNFPNDTLQERIDRILDNVTPVPSLSGVVVAGGVLNLQGIVDSDNDALGDWWEEDYFGDLSMDGQGDPDGDGFTTAQEFKTLTDPTSGSSTFRLLTNTFDSVEGARFHFQSAAGRSYQLWYRDSLATGSWQELGEPITGDGSIIELHDATAMELPKRFYRLSIIE